MKEVGFHSAFTFKYSERKHTIAERKYPDDVPDPVKGDRVARLVDLQRTMSLQKNQALVGHTVEVLVEGDATKSPRQWMGRTDANTTVVWEKNASPLKPGDLVRISIDRASAATLSGHGPNHPALNGIPTCT